MTETAAQHPGLRQSSRESALNALLAAIPRTDIEACYMRLGGPVPMVPRARRAEIDAALLAVQATGAHLGHLADDLGLGNATVDRAVRRAREATR